ncbi:MAG: hypothetical protein PHV13_05005 [Candidatus ainarchaeum sp.]|nr:hypothetical protein [Candidatus ainarchaeum sp.]
MRVWLLLAFLAIFGCVQSEVAGITPDNLPIGNKVNITLELVSKDQCIFGFSGFSIAAYTLKDPSICSNLTEDGTYRLQGTVSGYTQYESAWFDMLAQANLVPGNTLISSPIIAVTNLEEVGPEYLIVDEIVWSSKQNQSIYLRCSPTIIQENIAFASENGSESDQVNVPEDSQGNETVSLEEISFGTSNSDNSSYILVKTRENANLTPSDYDNYLKITDQNYLCFFLKNEDGQDYYYCEVFQQITAQDPLSFFMSFYRDDDWFCSGQAKFN